MCVCQRLTYLVVARGCRGASLRSRSESAGTSQILYQICFQMMGCRPVFVINRSVKRNVRRHSRLKSCDFMGNTGLRMLFQLKRPRN